MRIEAITLVAEAVSRYTFDVGRNVSEVVFRMQVRDPNDMDGTAVVFTCSPEGNIVQVVGNCSDLDHTIQYIYELEADGSAEIVGTVNVIQKVVKT